MTAKRDYYEILGVGRDATQTDIKRAYRRLAREHHPDVNPHDDQAEHRFKEINEAYQVLSDADKRAVYDRYGHAGMEQQFGAGLRVRGLRWVQRVWGHIRYVLRRRAACHEDRATGRRARQRPPI